MIALFVLWVCFNGRISWDVVIIGLAICAALMLLLKKAEGYGVKKEIYLIKRMPHVIKYLGRLFKEVVLANIAVMKMILDPNSQLQGQMIFFTPKLITNYARVLLGNSITLTPGTITVQLKNGRYCVHTISDAFVEDIERSTLVCSAEKLEEKFQK